MRAHVGSAAGRPGQVGLGTVCRYGTRTTRAGGRTEPPEVLVAWDLDNVRPTADQIKGFLAAPYIDLGRRETDVLLAANSWTLSKVFPQARDQIDALIRWGDDQNVGIEVIETERRRQAVDRVLTQRILEFAELNTRASMIFVVSNDSDFAPILRYARSMRPCITTITVGTCRPSRNANAMTKKPNVRLSDAADRTLRITWVAPDSATVNAHGTKLDNCECSRQISPCIVTELT